MGAEIPDGWQVGQGTVLESLEMESLALLQEIETRKRQLDEKEKELKETTKVAQVVATHHALYLQTALNATGLDRRKLRDLHSKKSKEIWATVFEGHFLISDRYEIKKKFETLFKTFVEEMQPKLIGDVISIEERTKLTAETMALSDLSRWYGDKMVNILPN